MIIGLTGKAQSGKDEFARIAMQEFGATRLAFADTLKKEVAAFLEKHEVCWEHRHLWGDGKDKEAWLRMSHYNRPKKGAMAKFLTDHADYNNGYHYFTPRVLMQYYGTEYRRAEDDNYWVKQLEEQLVYKTLNVVSDIRFINEINMLLGHGAVLVNVVRPSVGEIVNNTHASEVSLQSYTEHDFVIQNNGTLEDYQTKVRTLLKEILYGQ